MDVMKKMTPNPLLCTTCGRDLEADDAVSIIEGLCPHCRDSASSSDEGQIPTGLMQTLEELAARESTNSTAAESSGQRSAHSASFASISPGAGSSAADTVPAIPRPPARGTEIPSDRRTADDAKTAAGIMPETPPDRRAAPRPPPTVIIEEVLRPAPRPGRLQRRRRDLAIGMSVGLVLTAAMTAYLVMRDRPVPRLAEAASSTLRTITLRITPPWAGVKLDGLAAGPLDASGKLLLRLPEGDLSKRWLEVEAPGHHRDRRPLAMFAGANYVAIELVRKPYDVAIRTDPNQAEVWINEKLRGFSPLTISLLPQEEATLTVKRKGYEPLTQPVAPPQREERVVLNLALKPLGPVLRVVTDPPGANVMIDGAGRGVSPLILQLDTSALGQAVDVAASAPGYADATTRVALPAVPGEEADAVQFTLRRMQIAVEIDTTPPDGRVIIEGRDLGPAPVVADFDPAQVGRRVVVQAALAGSHYGQQEITVPPAGEQTRVTIPMEFNAQRVVLVLALSPDNAADDVALLDRAVDSIHRLSPEQRFALLIRTAEGIESWPGGLGTEAATSEQKVRAYDVLRCLRPSAAGSLRETLKTALAFKPTTIWLLTSRMIERDELCAFTDAARSTDLSVNVVTTAAAADTGPSVDAGAAVDVGAAPDKSAAARAGSATGERAAADAANGWLARWAASHNGTLTILRPDDASAVAMEPDSSEE